MASKTLLTIEEFLELDLPEDRRYELDEGEIVELTLPSLAHNLIVGRIFLLLTAWNDTAKAGLVFGSDAPCALGEGTLRGPDVSFVRKPHPGSLDLNKPLNGAPDLVIEVVSPSDRRSQLSRKVGQYIRAGAQEVWVVHPKTQTVTITNERGEYTFHNDDLLETRVLNGFSVRVWEFFSILR